MAKRQANYVADGVAATPFRRASAQPNSYSTGIAKRDVLKITTYAVMHFCVAVLVAFALTGDARIALSIGLVEPVLQTVAYTMHELGWSRLRAATEAAVDA